ACCSLGLFIQYRSSALLSTQRPNTMSHVCFPLCRTYAAHVRSSEMWCRDADVIALLASCGFEVEHFGPWGAALPTASCYLSPRSCNPGLTS
ncbi:hypothetical protein XENOCAPTIV_014332, partial [Xenoophorus captivus]